MADPARRLSDNVPGEFFVDSTCIDCDTCRQIAPNTFARSRFEQSFVAQQPQAADERRRAALAVVACPTSSIGGGAVSEVRQAARAFPERITEDVFYCGYASEHSYGASSYLVKRAHGNVLIDSPRAASPLVQNIERLGGIAHLFLTHRDDVADHARFHTHFGCERILHERDVRPATRDVERRLTGDDAIPLAEDLLAIPVPGHTRGSTALLYDGRYLFTGDHLWYSATLRSLHASRDVCWYSWEEQTRSIERLLAYDFEWVLPGHARRYHAPPSLMRRELEALVERMRGGR